MAEIERDKITVSILGDASVGKTSMISVLTGNDFNPDVIGTIGIDYVIDHVNYDGKDYKVKIIDTAGQETYHDIVSSTIKMTEGFVLVYSVESEESFNVLGNWLQSINSVVEVSETPIIICGNKVDLENKVITTERGKEFAQKRGFPFFETSAKTGMNIRESFKALYDKVYEKISKKEDKGGFQLDPKKVNKKKKCCI